MLNDLTKKLLAEGWTRENFPHETVFLKNFENFGWRWDVSKDMVWETPCGLLVEGRTAACSDLTYDGVWYCIENGNPLHRCPHEKHNCEHQPAELNKWCLCVLHRTERQELPLFKRLKALVEPGERFEPVVKVGGKRVPVLGQTGMTALTLDVTKCECSPRDLAVLDVDPRMVRFLPVEMRE